MEKITGRQVINLLDDIIIRGGKEDFIYGTADLGLPCLYIDEGKPSCLIAQLLVKAGVPLDELARYEGQQCASMPYFTDFGAVLARTAQRMQDAGETWGDAYKETYRVYRTIQAAWQLRPSLTIEGDTPIPTSKEL